MCERIQQVKDPLLVLLHNLQNIRGTTYFLKNSFTGYMNGFKIKIDYHFGNKRHLNLLVRFNDIWVRHQ